MKYSIRRDGYVILSVSIYGAKYWLRGGNSFTGDLSYARVISSYEDAKRAAGRFKGTQILPASITVQVIEAEEINEANH